MTDNAAKGYQVGGNKCVDPCRFEVPIRLQVPIFLELEVRASRPVCHEQNGYKPASEVEIAQASELVKSSE
jgi:hypothetical protein